MCPRPDDELPGRPAQGGPAARSLIVVAALDLADNIEAQLATFGPNRQGLVRIGNRGHQFNWVTNNKGQAIFVDATTGRVGTKLSDITGGLPSKFVTGDIQVNAFDLPH